MKKILSFLLLFIICNPITQTVFADEAIEGYIYSTDILTFVNGKPIDGYNIGGKTVVIAEDLNGYGFNVEYYDEIRTLKIYSYFNDGLKEFKEIKRGKFGEISGSIYKTDIKVYYNGISVKGYNIGGRTAICVEDLGDLSDSENVDFGYSKYLGKSIWNPDERTISFQSYMKNDNEILGISRIYHRFKDNVIYTFADDFCTKSEFCAEISGEYVGAYTYSTGVGISKYRIKPLYLDNRGELLKIGLCVQNPNNTENEPLMYIEDTEKVKNIIKTFKNPQKSYNESLAYFTDTCEIVDKIENDHFTVLALNHKEEGFLFVNINKKGGFVVDSFLSNFEDYKINFWFDNENADTVIHSVYPFAGPHGATTMQYATDLNKYDYE